MQIIENRGKKSFISKFIPVKKFEIRTTLQSQEIIEYFEQHLENGSFEFYTPNFVRFTGKISCEKFKIRRIKFIGSSFVLTCGKMFSSKSGTLIEVKMKPTLFATITIGTFFTIMNIISLGLFIKFLPDVIFSLITLVFDIFIILFQRQLYMPTFIYASNEQKSELADLFAKMENK